MTQPPSVSADGVWRHLRLAPGLAQPTQPVADGAPAALVVQQGVLRWLGPQQALPAAFAALPQHDACGAWATPGPPSQLLIRRRGSCVASGSSARAMSVLGTMAVGACMNSSVPVAGSDSSACSVCT